MNTITKKAWQVKVGDIVDYGSSAIRVLRITDKIKDGAEYLLFWHGKSRQDTVRVEPCRDIKVLA
ncbi:MAG: hypothetical protein OXG44_10720 [Gammaproteobacteria bacterium]|nr:hypothetical protein [Gammaproteobacteria bacterium]